MSKYITYYQSFRNLEVLYCIMKPVGLERLVFNKLLLPLISIAKKIIREVATSEIGETIVVKNKRNPFVLHPQQEIKETDS
jgi:hypothetical protein